MANPSIHMGLTREDNARETTKCLVFMVSSPPHHRRRMNGISKDGTISFWLCLRDFRRYACHCVSGTTLGDDHSPDWSSAPRSFFLLLYLSGRHTRTVVICSIGPAFGSLSMRSIPSSLRNYIRTGTFVVALFNAVSMLSLRNPNVRPRQVL